MASSGKHNMTIHQLLGQYRERISNPVTLAQYSRGSLKPILSETPFTQQGFGKYGSGKIGRKDGDLIVVSTLWPKTLKVIIVQSMQILFW